MNCRNEGLEREHEVPSASNLGLGCVIREDKQLQSRGISVQNCVFRGLLPLRNPRKGSVAGSSPTKKTRRHPGPVRPFHHSLFGCRFLGRTPFFKARFWGWRATWVNLHPVYTPGGSSKKRFLCLPQIRGLAHHLSCTSLAQSSTGLRESNVRPESDTVNEKVLQGMGLVIAQCP